MSIIMDTGGNCSNSAPGSRGCGSENTLQNILSVNLPPRCGIMSNHKQGPHLDCLGRSKSAAVRKGCHNKLLRMKKMKRKKKEEEKTKVGPKE